MKELTTTRPARRRAEREKRKGKRNYRSMYVLVANVSQAGIPYTALKRLDRSRQIKK